MKKIYLTLVAETINMFAQGWPANYSGVMLQVILLGFLQRIQMDQARSTGSGTGQKFQPRMDSTERLLRTQVNGLRRPLLVFQLRKFFWK